MWDDRNYTGRGLFMTTINLSNTVIYFKTLDTVSYDCPMSLDSLTRVVRKWEPARVILFVRYGFNIPQNIQGVLDCEQRSTECVTL